MTTDTVPKEAAIYVKSSDGDYTIGGIAKGSGMIH
ncbi:MAG: bifunctional ornithine acetyltransferase/N-acetylglutamate synthase, partial [Dehalococcoidales bacterium]